MNSIETIPLDTPILVLGRFNWDKLDRADDLETVVPEWRVSKCLYETYYNNEGIEELIAIPVSCNPYSDVATPLGWLPLPSITNE